MNGTTPDPGAGRRPAPPPLPVLSRVAPAPGVTLVARVLRHADPGTPVAVVLPAMGASARFYLPVVRALHEEGLTVVTVDHRGHGESTPAVSRGIRFGYREMAEEDLPAVVAAVRAEFPGAPLVLVGHSLGGQLALLYAAAHPKDVDALVLVAAGSVWYRGFGAVRGLRNLLASQSFAALATLIGYWPGKRFGFGGTEAAGVMRDWARQGRTGGYRLKGSAVDYERALGELALPLLEIGVDNDVLAPAGSREHLLSKVGRCGVDRWHYTTEAAGGKHIDHFRWVRYHRALCAHLAQWVLKTAAQGRAGHGGPADRDRRDEPDGC
ncbi:alpha/beta fold hydrolase [Streptomyces luomodiensis]|uniref:Alpha/beta fold hydrolase n=1 Tax=Streptomyces luomodiensis TaxID=3026192 RepID=A0ABY9US23_9ACTN|nr:alpha/beta fold hydrolase [Streptomyces sp. SCA4-21]WNE95281.1 alpha/beta fold hydrolase [Streptomyces sp. SCA4-21]